MLKSLPADKILRQVSCTCLRSKDRLYRSTSPYLSLRSSTSIPGSRSNFTSAFAQRSGHGAVSTNDENITAWITRLDPYLPLELRSRSWQDNLENFHGIRSIETLPEILASSGSAFPYGMFTHVALHQKRWDAVIYLSRAIFEYSAKPSIRPLKVLEDSPWSRLLDKDGLPSNDHLEAHAPYRNLRLSKGTGKPLEADQSLNFLADSAFLQQQEATFIWKSAIGQIWRCLGHVMIATTRENSPFEVDMLKFVLQVLASMHSHGIVSEEIYLFESNDVPVSVRKPPFLHLMSSRIMTALSDVMWRKAEPDLMKDIAYVVAKHSHKGKQSPAGDFGPRLRPLGHEVWLEFILWSCVYGSHFQEGVELINALVYGSTSSAWKTVPWAELQEILDAKILAQHDSRTAKSWFQRLATSIEGYSEDPPIIELGQKHISCEVVARLYDGKLSTIVTRDSEKWLRQQSIRPYVDYLGNSVSIADPNFRKHSLFRFIATNNENKLRLAKDTSYNSRAARDSTSDLPTTASQREQLEEDLEVSILTQVIAHHVDNENIREALQSYEKLKTWVTDSDSHPNPPSDDANITAIDQVLRTRLFLPASVLAPFIDLITRTRMFDLGKDILAPFLSNKREMDQQLFTKKPSPAVFDAVTRFAGATSDGKFFDGLWQKQNLVYKDITGTRLREILHHQAKMNSWTDVKNSLIFMTRKRRFRLLPQDVARLAVRVMHLEAEGMKQDSQQLMDILMLILRGEYRLSRPRGGVPDWTEARELNQMKRVLASIPVQTFSGLSKQIIRSGQLSNPVELPEAAFNILLEAVVDQSGSAAGLSLTRQWCSLSPRRTEKPPRPGDRAFKCVQPGLETLRILIKPFTISRRKSYKLSLSSEVTDEDEIATGMVQSLGGDRNLQSATLDAEVIVRKYYTEDATREDLFTLRWVIALCKDFGYDENNSFRTLLQPMEELTKTSDELVQTSIGHASLAIDEPGKEAYEAHRLRH